MKIGTSAVLRLGQFFELGDVELSEVDCSSSEKVDRFSVLCFLLQQYFGISIVTTFDFGVQISCAA